MILESIVTEDPERLQLEHARNGDLDAFSALVERYSARVYGVCFSYLGNRQDAEDCAQETFVKAFRAIADYQFLSSFYTWIYRIAANTCMDFRRRQSKHATISLDEAMETDDSQVFWQVPDRGPLPDELAIQAETRQLIREGIAQLPDFLREIIVLRDLEGLSYHELASLLNLSEGTVKSRLSRARNQLMLLLSQQEQSEEKRRLKNQKDLL